MVDTNWQNESPLTLKQATDTILISMLHSSGITKTVNTLTGGLSPRIAGMVREFIHAHFHRQIYLSELANIAKLSEYHFCRMFKESFARTPQEYLTYIRIEQVKYSLSHSSHSLTEIALACGFSNQSHMGRYFKKQTGITPKAFQKCS